MCLYVPHICVVSTVARRGHYYNNTDCYDPSSECWEQNLGLLQEQHPSKDLIRKYFIINRGVPFKKRNTTIRNDKRKKIQEAFTNFMTDGTSIRDRLLRVNSDLLENVFLGSMG